MSHEIKYVFSIPEPAHRERVLNFLKETIEDKENPWLTDLKIEDHSFFPVMQKGDITFKYSYKWDVNYIFEGLAEKLPEIYWTCELWDEEIGLCYIAHYNNEIKRGWDIIPDGEWEMENDVYS